MGLISQLTTWINLQVLTHTDLNAEFAQIINTVNALGNANWSAAGVDNLDGQKVDVKTNSTFLVEHSAVGTHVAFAACNLDMGYLARNSGSPDSKVDITFNRATVYNSDNYNTRGRRLARTTTASSRTADIGAANGAGGLDTGSVAASTEYFVWLIFDGTNDVAAAMLSLEKTIAGLTFPTDYTYGLLFGSVDTDADSDFLAPKPIPGAGIAETNPVFENAKDLSEDGYIHFGNGLIMQWGADTVAGDDDEVVTLPLEYPNAHLIAVASQGDSFNVAVENSAGCHTLTVTQLTLRNGSPTSQTLRWFSIGH
jgi:hypothetical protein